MIEDVALERWRRAGWARYYEQREHTKAVALWAVELVEFIEQTCEGAIPALVADVSALVTAHVDEADRALVSRYVRTKLGSAA